MPANLDSLVPEFKEKVLKVISDCTAAGLEMRPIVSIRTPQEQAKLWRQSRSSEEIAEKIKELESYGAPFLADCIKQAGPQNGPQVTKVGPGYSWHQWGEAVDCVWIKLGKAEWNDLDGYKKYASIARNNGLTAGAFWISFKDYPHIQFRKDEIRQLFSPSQIDREMRKRYA